MGNMFSTRWNGVRTRLDTGRLPYLTTADLRRLGALEPGAVANLTWTNTRGELVAAIRTRMHTGGDALTLHYAAGGEPVRERIPLQFRPANYGGVQRYLTCLWCGHRRQTLYCVDAAFRCRACHDLAYTVTREDDADRSRRREAHLYARLGATRDGTFTIPPKPRNMRRTTYAGIVRQLRHEHAQQAAVLRAFLDTTG